MWKCEITLKKNKSRLINLPETKNIFCFNLKQLAEFLTLFDEKEIKSLNIKRNVE